VTKLVVITLVISTLPTVGMAGKYIARVNGDGDILFERDSGFSADVVEMKVSEIDGSIFVSFSTSAANLRKFDENGYYDSGFDLSVFYRTFRFDIDYANHLWIPGIEAVGDKGLYEYTSGGGYVNGIEGFYPIDASFDDTLREVWAGVEDPSEESQPGVHKFTESGSDIMYIPGYRPLYIDGNSTSGSLWFRQKPSGKGELIKLNAEGVEEFRLVNFSAPKDPQVDPIGDGCWVIEQYSGDLYKLDAFGSVVFHDGSFSDIAAIDVNESDGSVWVASNVPKRLVHLDKDGNRLLYKQWPGGDFAHLAVDQRNGTCIVIYEEYKSGRGDVNIQPASVGEIKAMYAD
jgi:hypothetical protein